MSGVIVLLRGINVGGKNLLPMALLRELCEGVGLTEVSTLIQSGNVVGLSSKKPGVIASALGRAIEKRRGFRAEIVIRTANEWREIIDRNPFRAEAIDGGKLLVMILGGKLTPAASRELASMHPGPEVIRPLGREIYLHFPLGVGRSKLAMARVEKTAGVPGTCRNWNTMLKLRDMVEALGA